MYLKLKFHAVSLCLYVDLALSRPYTCIHRATLLPATVAGNNVASNYNFCLFMSNCCRHTQLRNYLSSTRQLVASNKVVLCIACSIGTGNAVSHHQTMIWYMLAWGIPETSGKYPGKFPGKVGEY